MDSKIKKTNDICLQITVVRHAATKFTNQKPRVLQGQYDIDINELGLEQAKALAHRLRKEHYDIIYCSDLLRTKSTLEQILEFHKDTPVVYTHDLREQDVGEFQGQTWQKCKEILNEKNISFEKALEEKGEPSNKFYERVVHFYSYLINKYVIEANNIQTKTFSRSNTFYSLNELSLTSMDDLHSLTLEDDPKSNPIGKSPSYNCLSGLLRKSSLCNSSSSTNISGLLRKSSFNNIDANTNISDLDNPKDILLGKQLQNTSLLQSALQNNINNSLNRSDSSNDSNTDDNNTKKYRMFRILIVTHGGFIKNLMKHLIEELRFKPCCDEQYGFPKNTGIYKFSIVNTKYTDGNHSIKDYKWKGKIQLMNCVAHLAILTTNEKKRLKQLKKEQEDRLKELKKGNSNYLLDNICGDIPDDFPGSAPKKAPTNKLLDNICGDIPDDFPGSTPKKAPTNNLLDNICGDIPDDFPGSAPKKASTKDDSSDEEDVITSCYNYIPQPQDNYYASRQFSFPSKSLGW